MKKVSISLFAVLAIVLGAMSAFKTSEVKRTTDWFYLNADVTPTDFSSNFNPTYRTTLKYTSVNPSAEPTSLDCAGTAKVCAIRIPTYTVGTATTQLDDVRATPLASDMDDFPTSAPTGSSNIKFKD